MASDICIQDLTEYALVEYLSTDTQSAQGGRTHVWSTLVNIWCKIEDTGGNESFIAGREEAVLNIKVTANYDATVTPKTRLVFDSKTYDITRVDNVDRRGVYMVIYAESEIL